MTIESFLTWREPLAVDWREAVERLSRILQQGEADLSTSNRVRRLAGMRLGDGERIRFRRLIKHARKHTYPLPGFRATRMLLVSNRTVSYLASDLEVSGAARGLLIEAVETEYDSVTALALDPATKIPDGRFDAVLLLLDSSFFSVVHGLLADADEEHARESAKQHLYNVVDGLRSKIGAPIITATIAIPPEDQLSSSDLATVGTIARHIGSINNAIEDCAKEGRLVLFDLATLASQIGTFTFFDPIRFHQTKVPFSFEASPVVADAITALVAAMTGRAGRVLVLDLDNTLWGGVVADDGLDQIVIGQGSSEGEAFLSLHHYALQLRRRGIVLAVCSKNLDDIARSPFRSHPNMLLQEDHFAIFMANFDDKATNLARISDALALDPSCFVFVDDNPAERERVRSALPMVMVPELPEDPSAFVRTINASGFLEHLPLTTEDTKRGEHYRARADATAMRASIGDYNTYLRSLEMEMSIASFDTIGRSRIVQLIQKSNQFNLTTKRYTENDIAAIEIDSRHLGWQIRLKDKFGDHGMICVIIAEKTASAWLIDTWVMSCRVLKRGVEQALMQQLMLSADRAGATKLIGHYRPTARNSLVKDFYTELGFNTSGKLADGTEIFECELSSANFSESAIRVAFH